MQFIFQVEGQTIRANELLHRKREKVNRKYTQTFRRERQLSPGFLEDGPEEVCFAFLFSICLISFTLSINMTSKDI